MKRLFFILSATLMIVACQSGDKKDNAAKLTQEEKEKALTDTSNYTSIQWLDSTIKQLGKLVKDQTIEITYRFKNNGTHNLIFESVTAPCGCTIPEKPEKAFVPGEEGVIRAKYNGLGQGIITKQINVKANTLPSTDHILVFTGTIDE